MNRRRIWWVAGGAAAVLAAGGVTAAFLLPEDKPAPLPIRARQYTDVRACLLTDSRGLGGDGVKPVWDGMQDASATTRAQVSWLAIPGGDSSVGRAVPFANTLIQQKCSVLVAAGAAPGQALATVADANPKVRFVVVGSGEAKPNLTVIPVDADVRTGVAKAVSRAGVNAG